MKTGVTDIALLDAASGSIAQWTSRNESIAPPTVATDRYWNFSEETDRPHLQVQELGAEPANYLLD